MILVTNSGPLIMASNYWGGELDRQGLAFLSINARALRLLMPRTLEPLIPDMATGKIVVASRPRNPSKYAMELMFDDGSDSPYCVHLSAGQVDRMPPQSDSGRTDLEFTAWTQPRRDDGPHEALRRPAAYRIVPWAKEWRS
jgi:hypothetical protein